MTAPEGEYIVIDPLVLETIRELAWLAQVDRLQAEHPPPPDLSTI